MEFERFKRRVQSAAPQGGSPEGLVYHRFLEEMFAALESGRFPDFSASECAESLGVLKLRFGAFLDELKDFPCVEGEDAFLVKERMGQALVGMIAVLDELVDLVDTPLDQRVAVLMAAFRQHNEVILEINREMEALSAEHRL